MCSYTIHLKHPPQHLSFCLGNSPPQHRELHEGGYDPNKTDTQGILVELVNDQVTGAENSEPAEPLKSGSLFTIPTCLSIGPSPSKTMPHLAIQKAHPVLSLTVRAGFALPTCLTWLQ